MSMKTYANHGYIIGWETLRANVPDAMKILTDCDYEEKVLEFMQGDLDNEDEDFDKIDKACDQIIDWGKSKGLDLSFDYTGMDEDNEEAFPWLCFCDNAVTENPVFKEFGESLLWTTYG